MLAGYFWRDGTAAVEVFFGTELNRQLLAMGRRVRWEPGVAQRLELYCDGESRFYYIDSAGYRKIQF